MKFTKTLLASAIAFTIAHANAAEWTTSAVIKNETAAFSKSGSVTGNYTTEAYSGTFGAGGAMSGGADVTHSSGDLMKSETSARIFVNGSLDNGANVHAEIRPVFDSKAIDDYQKHESYTQNDFLRELYIDTTTDDGTYLRIGKQQIVWGKADGAKFMDLINPTDYREMAQNAMDESRITVWGLNAEKILDDGSSLQFTVTQPRENVFAGLNRGVNTSVRGNLASGQDTTINNGTDAGHPFVLLGPDSITGQKNGFLNIVPDLGSVARMFAQGFSASGADNLGALASAGMDMFTVGTPGVGGYAAMTKTQLDAALTAYMGGTTTATFNIGTNYTGLAATTPLAVGDITGAQLLELGFGTQFNTTLSDYELASDLSEGTQTKDATFDYMSSTTFATFDAFVNAKSQYVYNMPDDMDVDLGTKWSKSFDNGLNASFAYSYNYDKNPIINLSWRNTDGDLLYVHRMARDTDGTATTTDDSMYYSATGTSLVLTDSAAEDIGSVWDNTSSVQNYGGAAQVTDSTKYGILRFEQTVERVHNIGTAMDYALDTESLGPVVLRGEFVYTKDSRQPVIDKDLLGIGDLVGALSMQIADRFKYVLGADVTVLTDMMVSAQFIQDRNLDFVDGATRYTTSYPSMHMSNQFIKDIENKEFYSLFFSKPFGDSGEGRWNNITMLEEGGGRWNRFDVEYSLSNEVVGTFEVNKYWGDANSQFGQLENSSNVQVGLKYIIE